MDKLNSLPNIGENLQAALKVADIHSPKKLRQIGAKEAFLRLWLQDPTVCLNRLCVLQGAIQGIRRHHLPEETKSDLRAFFRS